MIQIGIIGVGTVGSSVVKLIEDNKHIIRARTGKDIVVKRGVVKNLDKKRDVDIPISNDINDVIEDDDIDIVVELSGGVKRPFEIVRAALKKNKAVVTANKAMLSYHRYELEKEFKNSFLHYEASVGGGIPIVKALKEGLNANEIISIEGIMNGTCNYILTKMIDEGLEYKDILKEAQELGYAEADPTFDVEGFDTAHKLLILASLAYDIDVKPEDILIEGIENICVNDISFAKEFGYSIKLLGIAKNIDGKIDIRVHPVLLDKNRILSKVDGVMNAINITGNKVGESIYYGAGAGGDATASSVVSDIIDIVTLKENRPTLGFKEQLSKKYELLNKDDIKTSYYVKIDVEDKMGVFSKIATIFNKHNISLEKIMQKPNANLSQIQISTHKSKEYDIKNAIKEVSKIEHVKTYPTMIRIE